MCIENHKKAELIQSIKMLAASSVRDVICDWDTLVQICGPLSCDEIMVVKVQTDNVDICRDCTRSREGAIQSEKACAQNYHKQVSNDSRTRYNNLTDEQKIERLKNLQREKVKCGRCVDLLE